MVRRFYPWADAVVAVSDGVAADTAEVARIPRDAIRTIYNPADVDDIARQARLPVDHPWLQPGGPPLILGVGRLAAQKDFPTLLRAFARLRQGRDARLVILGEGRQRPALEALVAQLGLAECVDLPGYEGNPFRFMARAALFVLSSRYEGLPGALIQALACGCPVVSTDCPSGPHEILEGGDYGPLVPVGDDMAMAEGMERVLASPPDPDRQRRRAECFSVDACADQYLDLLLGLADRGSAGADPVKG
jgi:glycosyltransferase involved in cell wall biosynthesis